ncbi:hypothetical protein WG915_07120 [Corynebacterium sp. H128]|uniref:hypothetical protein n=1 Tax=unclassified Corynebacterium TaxID=2624378 RepID=UPI00309661A3
MYDRDAVRFFDVAHEGAYVRGAANLLRDGWCTEIRELRPRSLVVVVADDLSRAAAECAIALLEPLPLPISVVSELPRFAGPLDAVLVASSKGSASQEISLHAAAQRGCPSLLIAPSEGPLRAEAPAQVTLVGGPPNGIGGSPASVIAAMYAVVASLTRADQIVLEQLELAADGVDAELLAVAPERDELVNEARALKAFAAHSRVIHTGNDGVGRAIANLMAVLWTGKAMVSGVLEAAELAVALPELQSAAPDVFYDPFEPTTEPVLPLRIVVWAQPDTTLPFASAQSSGDGSCSLENMLRLIVRGLAAAVL